ncbi:hypothetical protein [Egbenema bharatensis]|uniref:hypothetical protein n=1 Tax=Egbenema bharatensis TaxID=3463334 RepID=UPI003A8C4D54
MKSKANSNPVTRTPSASGQSPSASVPLSVYRELAAELQATRAMVDSLNSKNQDLTLQNQRLRQEIQRFVKAAMNLQVLVEPTQSSVNGQPATHPATAQAANPPTGKPRRGKPQSGGDYSTLPTLEETAAASAVAAQLRSPEVAQPVTEPEAPPRPKRDFSGLWLTFIVIAIMVSAFGAGFLVVRPLLPTADNEDAIENQFTSPEADPDPVLSPSANPSSP